LSKSFWKWYLKGIKQILKGIKQIPRFVIQWLISGWMEFVVGVVLIASHFTIVLTAVDKGFPIILWTLILVPAWITMTAHGWFRMSQKDC